MLRIFKYCCFFTLAFFTTVSAERIKDMIYMSIDGAAACFRRHNGTHQFGCSSDRSGSVGVIHILELEEDIEWLEKNATASPYIVVMPFSMFKREVLLRFKSSNKVNGILLARNITHERPPFYSPEDKCPNRYSGYTSCDDSKPWNPHGSALLMEDWSFPIFYIQNNTVLEEVKKCFWTYNAHDLDKQNERPLCALEMNSYMFAALNSESCIRRTNAYFTLTPVQYCDPLGDRNIHWPLSPITNNTESVIMIIARLDASSLFDGLAPGAVSAVTGFVTLLATACYLHSLNATVDKTNVVFSLLSGESFDYIGSSRLVYDLKNGNFKALGGKTLTLDKITEVIELNQLDNGEIYLHTSNDEGNELIPKLKSSLNASVLKDSVPPVSVQRFLLEKSNLSTIVIAGYGEEFVNKYYNSILDDANNTESRRNDSSKLASNLTRVAIELGNVLYEKVTGLSAPTANESYVEDLVSQMLYCYLHSANCSLFRAASPPGSKISDTLLPLYVGVNKVANLVTTFTGQLLALLTGTIVDDRNSTTCNGKQLFWMGGFNYSGVCVNVTAYYSVAESPAFIIDDYDMKSGKYSTWTESIWQSLSARMFLKPSPASERFTIILGSAVTVFSFVLVWFVKSRKDILFQTSRAVSC